MFARIQLRENVGGRAAQLQRGFGRDWLNVGHATNAVGSEYLLCLRHVGYVRDSPAAFISLILRCNVRRLMPSFCAALVMLPFVVASACMMSRFSVSWRLSALDFSPNAFPGVIPPGKAAPVAARTLGGRSRTVSFEPRAITTPCSIAVRSSRTFPGQP